MQRSRRLSALTVLTLALCAMLSSAAKAQVYFATVCAKGGGGNGNAAQAMGIVIRERRYNTYVDGSKDRCASACTHIFASGVKRYYAGAGSIVTGPDSARGLGYHYPNSRHTDQTDADKDKGFNAMTVPYLHTMLSPAGATAVIALMSGNRTTKVTWLNGDEALRAGIATSLEKPNWFFAPLAPAETLPVQTALAVTHSPMLGRLSANQVTTARKFQRLSRLWNGFEALTCPP